MGTWKKVQVPLHGQDALELNAGDQVLLSGVVYTARDAAHGRLIRLLEEGQPLPIDLKGAVIYYVGPCPPKSGHPVGSAGPTTSGRMDGFTPRLLDAGMGGMIGKGERSAAVVESIRKNKAIYFVTIGGAGAYLAQRIHRCQVVAFPELGAEAIYRMEFCDFPAFVAVDAAGRTIF